MDTRILGYVGLGILIGIIVATLLGLPPVLWILAAVVVIVATVALMLGQTKGASDAARIVASTSPAPELDRPSQPAARASDVEMELVREADAAAGTPAVWLHRRGGRRVHRVESSAGWVVQRVSTKDPDNPRKRVLGEPFTFVTEAEAIAAADELAQGQAPDATVPGGSGLAVAKA